MEKQKIHEICFCDVENDWDSALPVGNGRLGAMVFFKGRLLHIAVNHYDCYYHGLTGGQGFQDPARFTETYEELCRRAEAVRNTDDAERSHYARTLHPPGAQGRPSYRGASYPQGGELLLELDEKTDLERFCLTLRIEEAAIVFEAGLGAEKAEARIWVARESDGVMIYLNQTEEGLWKSGSLVLPAGAGMGPFRVACAAEPGNICMRTVYGNEENGGTAFSQELVFSVAGYGRTALCQEGDYHRESLEAEAAVRLELTDVGKEITTVLSLQPGSGRALKMAELLGKEAESAEHLHRKYWRQFWSGRVSLPDLFLEKLWYLQLYLMECSCGRGGAYPEQACGLSGLWDIRRPNMWGSMWYWDVNIQSAFWGAGCAGHPELWKVFCDSYLSYQEDIRAYTRRVYGIDGWALDYPHTLYHCIQPWCAQFLWEYYQYSGDRGFLEEKAYPVFQQQLDFFRWLAVRDEQGIFHVEYDISPEQGPVTRDSVITISCIRRLARMAVEAGLILNRPEAEIARMQEILDQLPAYPVTEDGSRHRDSALAPEHLFLRHPSILMPLFPSGDALAGGEKEDKERWERTLSYAAEHTETGTFGMGWLAAAAAGLGRGRTALRLIYEKGLDYIMHTNGLAYEESERFLNYCHLTKPAHYLPVMMESAGGLVNAVNLILLQRGEDGVIRVFPAVPDDTEDILERIVQYREDDRAVEGTRDNWDNAEFSGLLTAGGFRVSARRMGGLTVFLKVESIRGGILKLALPGELSLNGCESVIERQMKAGETLCWGQDTGSMEYQYPEDNGVLYHVAARTHRRVYLGADRHTAYHRAVDDFTCAYLSGNELKYPRTPYIFDFGCGEGGKNYGNSYPPQIVLSGGCVLYAAGPKGTGPEEYTHETGYGFRESKAIKAVDRGEPDSLRRDFLEGTREAVFMLRLPKGRYDFLLVCGDEKENSCTIIDLPQQGTVVSTGKLGAGRYGCKTLPLALEQDGLVSFRIRTAEGCKWKLNVLFVVME